jgi:hypothetical protein
MICMRMLEFPIYIWGHEFEILEERYMQKDILPAPQNMVFIFLIVQFIPLIVLTFKCFVNYVFILSPELYLV